MLSTKVKKGKKGPASSKALLSQQREKLPKEKSFAGWDKNPPVVWEFGGTKPPKG